ncbi:lipase 1-like [Pectinophora gossypiella]|uniref:lipase 1-like n=1 Tax=Pectinophora gossypiella TaxID=13191 RepID=UPI00214EBC65|nr:lipase 1-like [Pectinophora gossypiella]
MKFLVYLAILLSTTYSVSGQLNVPTSINLFEGKLNFTGFAQQSGYSTEEYNVTTEDGYILTIFRIPGNSSQPVYLQHGLFGCSEAFIMRGNTSIAIALADEGYDVWVGNLRGNRYARRHTKLDPDTDKDKFFDYSFQEYGYYDMAAIIDFILDKTGQEKLSAMGHSEGNTFFYVLGATRPEYNDKINIAIALGPICFLDDIPLPTSLAVDTSPIINSVLKTLDEEELIGPQSLLRQLLVDICSVPDVGYKLCFDLIGFPLVGYDAEQFEPEFEPTLLQYYFSGSSRKNLNHLAQVARSSKFAKYDYGKVKNLVVYKSLSPPEYDLSKVTMNMALIVGANDKAATVQNANRLNATLPNVVKYHIMEQPKFNHIDFIVGRDTNKFMYPVLFELLEKYNNS